MSTVVDVLRLDVLTVRPYARQMLLLLALAGVLGVVMSEAAAVLPMAVVYSVMATGYPFAVADKNDLDTLYRTLPVSRTALVVGRYLFALAVFAAAVVGGGLMALGLASVQGALPEPGEMGLLLAAAFALFAVVVALQYPFYLALGYMKARLVAVLPFALLLAAGVVVRDQLDPRALPDLALAVPLLVGVPALLLGASVAVSLRLDARRVA